MWLFNQPSTAARTALLYITVGALVVTWSGIWYVYLHNNPPERAGAYYVCTGLLLTGLVLFAIGFGVGRIGRAAKQAEQTAAVVGPTVSQEVNGTVPVATTAGVPVATPVAPAPAAAVPVPQAAPAGSTAATSPSGAGR